MTWSFEHPFALFIIIMFLICKILCPPKTEGIIFPNADFFSNIKHRFSLLETLIIILVSISLASPIKSEILSNQHKKGYDIVTVLDTSGSMAEFNKLENAKAIIAQFAQKRKNDRLGLVIFGNIAYIASPLTYDKKIFKEILERVFVSIAGGRTAMYDALFLSSNLFKNSQAKNKIIILITDGQDNSSITPLDVVLKKLKKENIKVYTIGIGPDVDFQILQTISKETNVKFFYIKNKKELKKVFETINKLEKSDIKGEVTVLKKYYFQYPLSAALILFLIFLAKYRRHIWNF
ncbi:vWA domain-containing protein [Caminibacter sp.]